MKYVIVGHRGVGKSSLLKRMKSYLGENPDLQFLDLDVEVEKFSGKSVSQIFSEDGESYFRNVESEVLSRILARESSFVMALGAGCNLNLLSERDDIHVLWVRRATDHFGRIFLDRPKLNHNLSDIEEYAQRSIQREFMYRQVADQIYMMPEGLIREDLVEKRIVLNQISDLGGYYSLTLEDGNRSSKKIKRLLKSGIQLIELRTDLFSTDKLTEILQWIPRERALVSIRSSDVTTYQSFREKGMKTDWALELGLPQLQPDILSLHNRLPGESVRQAGRRLVHSAEMINKKYQFLLKLAVPVHNFEELQEGIEWQRQNPRHNFFPMSEQGRWHWVRLYLKNQQKMNFIREGEGTSLDQPTIYQWYTQTKSTSKFAAVLGDPVVHSYSPATHREYFERSDTAFYSINIKKEEWSSAWKFLGQMGLAAAAVTSPLKELAYSVCESRTSPAQEFKSVNTLFLGNSVVGHNTDVDGIRKLLADHQNKSVVIWGGGGVLPPLRSIFPRAPQYSASQQVLKEGVYCEDPEVLIWAAAPGAASPQFQWRPKAVVDLNYREDSLARSYAKSIGATYVSGLVMFEEQARQQQNFWSECYGKQ